MRGSEWQMRGDRVIGWLLFTLLSSRLFIRFFSLLFSLQVHLRYEKFIPSLQFYNFGATHHTKDHGIGDKKDAEALRLSGQ